MHRRGWVWVCVPLLDVPIEDDVDPLGLPLVRRQLPEPLPNHRHLELNDSTLLTLSQTTTAFMTRVNQRE